MYTYVATCLFGLEKLLGEEIDALGYQRIDTMDGRVTFQGDINAIARCNIFLRFAERVYIKMGECRATTFTELFDGAAALPWEEWIGKNDAFPVTGHAIKSALFSVPDCQKIIKKAIVNRLSPIYGISRFPETENKYRVEFFIFRDVAYYMIETSGAPLHKRGYRPESVAAPLRETLAAAIAAISRPRENVLLWDPFCGSGTIAIEAAMMMQKRAPGMNRAFAAEEFPQISADIWRHAREEAHDSIVSTDFRANATDIDPAAIRLTRQNAERAGVAELINAYEMDARQLKNNGERGTVVTNPPYGERLMSYAEVEKLYGEIGRTFAALDPWQVYILTSDEQFERHYGKRADKVRKLYNGMIPCRLYQFFKSSKTLPKRGSLV